MNKKFFLPFFAILFLVFLITSVLAITGSVSPSRIDYTGNIGKLFLKTITIKNTNEVSVVATVSSTIPNIVLSQTSFTINANSSYILPFNVTIVNEGAQQGKINVRLKKSGTDFLDLFTTINLYGNPISSNSSENNNSSNNSTDYENSSNELSGNGDALISATIDPATPNPIAGKDIIINANIKNIGEVTTDYSISINGYEDFAELLIIYPQTINLLPDEEKTVKIQMHIKNNISGIKSFNIRAENIDFYNELPLSINIIDNFNVDLIDVAYVVKNTNIPDYNFINAINQLGYSYTLIGSSQVPTTDFSGYKMILLGDERISNVPVNSYKSLFANPDYYAGWSASKASTSKANVYNANQNISITKSLDKSFLAYINQPIDTRVYYLTRTKNATTSVTTTGNSTVDLGHFVISTKDNPRRVFFGITKSNYWSDESRLLFQNSLYWIIKGEDKDNDTYFTDFDCNDNNNSTYRTVKAYVDNDNDGFGTGPLIDVCIGNNLPQGYSFINGDCIDNNPNANPAASEIPYNNVDDDCNGYDKADVDGDGYCRSGYFVQNAFSQCINDMIGIGTDCVDNDPTINIGSSDIFKNCKNDAPLIDNILKITVYETDDVIIDVRAVDPENNTLAYTINDTRFSNSNNVFTWITTYNDAGNYIFQVNASDGILTNSTYVYVDVQEKNRAPVCNDIPDIIWNENENISIDLKDYCSDLDGDDIEFSLYEVGNENIIADVNDNGIVHLSSNEYWNGNSWIKFKLNDGKDDMITDIININVNPVNQGPILIENLDSVILHEDTPSINLMDLNDFIFDVDSNLIYSVTGNNNVGIVINGSLVSFYPTNAFVGNESLVFSATDGEFNINLPTILEVLYVRKAPKFTELNCTNSILEDTEYSCELSATDAENDSFTFSVVRKNNLNCVINGTALNYIGFKDHTGNASCMFRVNDNDGHNDLNFNAEIENINDPPYFSSYSPQNNTRVYNNTEKIFRIDARDIDSSNLSVNWFLGNETVGNGASYNFRKTIGWYDLSSTISDGEFNVTNVWSIYVGLSNDFTCSEMNGHICAQNQICAGETINVYDTSKCCSVACTEKPPVFMNIKRENNITSNIFLELIKPVNSTEFKTTDKISVELRVENDASENIDFDVFAYLYDNSKEDIIEKATDSFKLDEQDTKITILPIEIPRKLKENDDFYIFAKVIGKGKKNSYYNEKYVKIKITRKADDIVIENIEVNPKEVLCGDNIQVSVKVKNYGSKSNNAYITAESSIISGNKQSPDFTLEDYNSGDNSAEEIFNLKINDNAKEGEYKIKAFVYYNSQVSDSETSIVLGECKTQNTETKPIVNQNITSVRLESRVTNVKESPQKIIFSLISSVVMLVMFLVVVIMIKVYSKNLVVKKNEQMVKKMIRMKKKRK